MPRPESFDRDQWHDEVEKGYQFYAKSGRTDLDPPPMEQVVAYFRSLRTGAASYPEPKEADTLFRALFATEKLEYGSVIKTAPAIAGLSWTKPAQAARLSFCPAI